MRINKELLLLRIEKLCEEKGIKPTTAYIESGAGKNFKSNMNYAEPTLGKISLLASYFGVSVSYLIGETDDPTPENKKVFFNKEAQKIILTTQEETIIIAYRNTTCKNKQLIHTILDIEEYQFQPTMIECAARNGIPGEHEIPKEKAEEAKNFPDVTDDI